MADLFGFSKKFPSQIAATVTETGKDRQYLHTARLAHRSQDSSENGQLSHIAGRLPASLRSERNNARGICDNVEAAKNLAKPISSMAGPIVQFPSKQTCARTDGGRRND